MSKESYVYMLMEHQTNQSSNTTNNYKIGFSATPKKRVGDLRGGNCRSITFKQLSQVNSDQAAKKAEKEMHNDLDKYRIKNRPLAGTEWFYVEGRYFKDFEDTYIRIANKYKLESLNHLDEANFRLFSIEEAERENQRALEE